MGDCKGIDYAKTGKGKSKTVWVVMMKSSFLVRAIFICGFISPLLFVTVFLLDGATRPDYDPMFHWISHLSLGERGWIGITNLIIIGVNCIILGIITKKTIVGKDTVWGPRLIIILGIGLILSGVFTIDPLMGYPKGAIPRLSLIGISHLISSFMMYEALIAACFVMANQFSPWFSLYSTVSGILIIFSIVIYLGLTALYLTDIYIGGPIGLFERISMMVGCLWLVVFSTLLMRRIRR